METVAEYFFIIHVKIHVKFVTLSQNSNIYLRFFHNHE